MIGHPLDQSNAKLKTIASWSIAFSRASSSLFIFTSSFHQLTREISREILYLRAPCIILYLTDTPPGTSDEHLTVVKALKNVNPDGAVVVTTPQEVALVTIRKELNFCRKMDLTVLGIVENMSGFVCPYCQVC